MDSDGYILKVNEKWKQFTRDNDGDQDTFYIGNNYLQICSRSEGKSEAISGLALTGIRRVLSGDDNFRCEYPCHSPTVKRWFELTASPLRSGDKRYALVTHRNVTTRHIQTQQSINSGLQQNMLAAIVATSTDAIMSYDLEGNILSWNNSALELYGYSAEEIVGRSMELLYPDNYTKTIGEFRDQILSGELTSFEAVRKRKDGHLRNVAISCAPVRDQFGEVICISNIHRDITHIKLNEEQLKLITGELGHRAKNQLAVVRSFSNQTAKHADSFDEYKQKFDDRLLSLAKSIDLLVSRDWSTVSLEKLCRSQIELFTDARLDTVAISGPGIILFPAAVEAIGMALHELATNAAKHGALVQTDGHISLTWNLLEQTDDQCLKITWLETGLNIDRTPTRKGFGHTVLTRLAKSSLGSDATYEFSHQGLIWEIIVPAKFYRHS